MAPIIVDTKQKRKQILEAAIKIIAEKGIENSRIEDIAREAGIGKGTVYAYFPSKEALHQACLEYILYCFMENHSAADLTDGTVLEGLRSLFDFLKKVHTLSYPREYYLTLMELWMIFMKKGPSASGVDFRPLYNDEKKHVVELFKRGIREGVFREVDPEAASMLVMGIFDLFVFEWILGAVDMDDTTLMDTSIDIIMNGLLAGGSEKTKFNWRQK